MSSVQNRDQIQGPLSQQLAERYDLAWMGEEDVTTRLWRSLRLLRNIVPIVYQANVVVEWASPACQYCGLMIQDAPPRILIDPKPVLSCTPRTSAAVLDAIQGVGLHEAGHAAHTPEQWGERAGELLSVHARTTGRRLPEVLLMPILNWAEDIYVEDRVAQEFPGFRAYFDNACTFFLPMSSCRRRLRILRTLLAEFRRDPHELADIARLVQSVLEIVIVAVRYPGVFDRQIHDLVPEAVEAAHAIRCAGGEADLDRRLGCAIDAGDRLLRLYLDLLRPAAGGDGGPTPADNQGTPDSRSDQSDQEAMELLERAAATIAQIRQPMLRDAGDPLGVQPATTAISLQQQQELEAREHGPAQSCAGQEILALARPSDERTMLRIVDSTPQTLPPPPASIGDPDAIAASLRQEYRALMEDTRRRLRFRDSRLLESITRGLREGDLDETQLARVATGERHIYYRREQTAPARIELTVLVDESGSMLHENRWRLAAAASICIEYAVRNLSSVRLRVYGYTGIDHETLLLRHYDSALPRLRRPFALGYSYPKASTPTPLALAGLRSELREKARPAEWSRVLILVSDGQPDAYGQRRHHAARAGRCDPWQGRVQSLQAVAAEVQRLRTDGIEFTALQIGDGVADDDLTTMYGRRCWLRISRPDDIPSGLVRIALTYLDRH